MMDIVNRYVKANNQQFISTFNSIGSQGELEATKVFEFFQSIFDKNQIIFLKDNKNYFSHEQNSEKMEGLIEEYYKTTPEGKDSKFYMYRIKFSIGEVLEILKYWFKVDQSVQVLQVDANNPPPIISNSFDQQIQNKNKNSDYNVKAPNGDQVQDSDGENDSPSEQYLKKIPGIIESYENEIQSYEQKLKSSALGETQIKQHKEKIIELKSKIGFLHQKLLKSNREAQPSVEKVGVEHPINANSASLDEQREITVKSEEKSKSQRKEPDSPVRKKNLSPQKMHSILRNIFEFYARQQHSSGVKASFQRIEQESSRINYQKLVHFLKEFEIFPSQSKDQKKLHLIYVKYHQNTRDLSFKGFVKLIEALSELVIDGGPEVNKVLEIKQKIANNKHRIKVVNPFRSQQKQDFRIDKKSLRYEFKLVPLNGKSHEEINDELKERRQIKNEKKQELEQQRKAQFIKKIKKLESIDPYNPLVEKNKHLITEKSIMELEPIVSLDNLEKFRDESFNVDGLLGIQEKASRDVDVDDIFKKNSMAHSSSRNNESPERRRVKQIEKIELDKMKNLMSGIIERSNAKLQKLKLSPNKRRSELNRSSLV